MKTRMISKKIVLIIELLILFIFITGMIITGNYSNEINIDIADMITDYEDAMIFDGQSWTATEETGADYWGYDYLIYSPEINLKKGSYTVVIDYETKNPQHMIVESHEYGEEVFKGDAEFYLSRNKKQVSYDFSLTNSVDDFRVRLIDYPTEYFSFKGLKIMRNANDLKTGIVIWIALCIIANIFLFSKKIKNNKKTIGVIIGTALVASIPLFINGILVGHDIDFHLVRIESIAEGLKNGYFPVKMNPVFNDGYGYPSSIYYGDLLLYIPATLRLIGFSITSSYKAFVFFLNLCVAALAYYCGKEMFKKNINAYVFTMIYTLSTYRLSCLYVREAVGEYIANCFLLLIMLSIWNIYTQDVKELRFKNNTITLALGMTGLIYHHVLSTQMAIIVLVVLALSLYQMTFKKERLLVIIKAAIISFLLCLAYIIPFIEYYTTVDTMLDDEYASSYIQNRGVYISDYFAFFKNVSGKMSVDVGDRMQITPGLVLMLGLVGGIILVLKRKATKRIIVMTVGSLICLFVASNMFPWNAIYDIPGIGQFLVQVQYPSRYVGMSICFMSILFVLVIEHVITEHIGDELYWKYSMMLVLFMTVIFVSSLESSAEQMKPYDTANLKLYTNNAEFGHGDTGYLLDNSDTDKDIFDYAVYGKNINNALIQSESGLKMEIWVDAGDDAYLEVPRFNYPYFKVTDSNGKSLHLFKGSNNKIRVKFDKAYTGDIILDFVEPLHWRIAEIVSLLTIVGIVVSVVVRNRKYH